jgi:predicted ATP-dependent protease
MGEEGAVSDCSAVTPLRPADPAPPPELAAAELRWRCPAEALGFASSEEVTGPVETPGQPRALAALELAFGIEREGFNVFAFGRPGTGRHTLVRELLARHAATRPSPDDWCYVHDFRDEHRPRLLRLPAGRGPALRHDLAELVRELRTALPALFEGDELEARRKALDEEVGQREQEGWDRLREDARSHGISVARTPLGFVFAPVRGEEPLSPEEFEALPADQRTRLEGEVQRLRGEVEKLVRHLPALLRERRRRLDEIERELARRVVAPLVEELRQAYDGVPDVRAHLEQIEEDVVERARELARRDEAGEVALFAGLGGERGGAWARYRVNLLVENQPGAGAPVVYEDNPTLANLLGRIEHLSHLGTLVTDFTLIKPGALHRANGGFLVLDADRVLRSPLAWEALKRALRSRRLRIESLAEALSLHSTVTLEPEPMRLAVRVVLIGEPLLYYLLGAYDPDLAVLFKVGADFADRLECDDDGLARYVRMVAGLARREGLRPLQAAAVARAVEHGARMSGDTRKLSLELGTLVDLLQEADHRAGAAGRPVILAEDVRGAIDAQVARADRLRELTQERLRRGLVLVDTAGAVVGQANGLAVVLLDHFTFAHPVRITARVRLGEGEVIDVEREVELAGPLHAKGVLILEGFLGQRYAPGLPLSLHATLVCEQSYGGIEGDSASLAELCALLSAIGELPLDQGVAITGSVNQHGAVQPIGSVNEKVEGFFDLCRARGLDGRQGVIVPAGNRDHLMLREEVVEAVAAGRFHVWPVINVDQALALLAGLPAGERQDDGAYPAGSANERIETRLLAFAAERLAFEKGQAVELVGPLDVPAAAPPAAAVARGVVGGALAGRQPRPRRRARRRLPPPAVR